MTQPEIAETAVATAPHQLGGLRWLIRKLIVYCGISFFATIIFLVSLLATFPATAVKEFVILPPQVTELYGSLWRGRAQLVGGNTLEWTNDPKRLLLLRVGWDVVLKGPDTQLTGAVILSPWAVEVLNMSGRAGPGLLQLVPGVPIESCSARAVVDVQMLQLARAAAAADGRIAIEEGSCVDAFERRQPVPQMTVDLLTQGADALAVLTDRDGELARFTVAGDRRLIVRVEPAGATLVPGLPTSGPIILEYPF